VKEITVQMTPSKENEELSKIGGHLRTVETDNFVMHHFQSSSGILFIMNSDVDAPGLQSHLQNIYTQIFVECVTRNPFYRYLPDKYIECPLFDERLGEYVKNSFR